MAEQAKPTRRPWWRLWDWSTHPRVTNEMRDLCTGLVLGQGIIRTIDGNLFPTPQTDYAPSQVWGVVMIIIGVLLVSTRGCKLRSATCGRLVASAACGFCVAFAVAVYNSSAASAYVHLVIAYIMALEAQVHECK
jgi:hypothetical protein